MTECGAWQRDARLRVMGVDPGFANTGVAVLEAHGTRKKWVSGRVVVTAKDAKRHTAMRLRVSVEDGRRSQEIYEVMDAMVRTYRPQVMAVEAYVPAMGPGRGGGNAWKTAITFGVIQAVAHANDVLALTFLPMDIRRRLGLAKGASKADVAEAAGQEVAGLSVHLQKMPKGQREHAADAAALALLGIDEVAGLRAALGRG